MGCFELDLDIRDTHTHKSCWLDRINGSQGRQTYTGDMDNGHNIYSKIIICLSCTTLKTFTTNEKETNVHFLRTAVSSKFVNNNERFLPNTRQTPKTYKSTDTHTHICNLKFWQQS
jgi:hypothetical protein